MPASETFDYKILHAQEAHLMSQCVEKVYGSTYPVARFYDPAHIRQGIEDRLLYPLVAISSLAGPIASNVTALEVAGDYTADGSAFMVAENYRGRGITSGMGTPLVSLYQRLGLVGLHLYALALHDMVQNQSMAAGAVITGILPAWFNSLTEVSGFQKNSHRTGAVCLYMPLNAAPSRQVYIPSLYADITQDIYKRCNLAREFLYPDLSARDLQPNSQCTELVNRDNKDIRLLVKTIGSDLESVITHAKDTMKRQQLEVCYLDLPLSDPAIDHAVRQARDDGFVFGMLGLERRNDDWLRLQYYAPQLADSAAMVIPSPEGKQLLARILAESKTAADSY